MIVILTVIGLVVMAMKHIGEPGFPAFLYNILPSTQADRMYFIVLSFLAQAIFHIYAWALGVHLIVGSLNFCRSVGGCLDIISFQSNKFDKTQLSSTEFLSGLDKSLKYFKKLGELTDQENAIFAWTVFSQFGGYLGISCIMAFMPLQYWSVVPKLSLLMYIFIFATLMVILCLVFPVMGSVYDESILYVKSWTKGLAYSKEDLFLSELSREDKKYFKLLKFRLRACDPFGVKCGDFFIIRKSTMLTFFSVISTYLIIMLQFDF